jgi:hypothetical protein
MHHFVMSGDSFFHPAGETQPDVRVLRPTTYYGDFGEDGRLKWGVGDEVVVGEAFTVAEKRGREEKKELAKDTEGRVLEFNTEGAAKIAFREPVSAELWVPKDQFYRLFPLPNARDTPIQRRVKLARLRRCDVLALVLYTGVCVYLCGCEPRELILSLSRVYSNRSLYHNFFPPPNLRKFPKISYHYHKIYKNNFVFHIMYYFIFLSAYATYATHPT